MAYSKPQHPKDVVETTIRELLRFATSEAEKEAISNIVRISVTPPNLELVRSVTEVLFEFSLINTHDRHAFNAFDKRNQNNKALESEFFETPYPVPHAILLLRNCDCIAKDNRTATIRFLISLTQQYPEKFTGNMYYKHVIAFRDTCEDWLENAKSSDDPLDELVKFIEASLKGHVLEDHERGKYDTASRLLDRRLLLGDAKPRGRITKRGGQRLGASLSVSEAVRRAIAPDTRIQSADVEESFMDDDGVSTVIDYPEGATPEDKAKIYRYSLNGFARTNVRTVADMAALSAVTYSDYLHYANENADDPEYALIWIAAFAGLDASRPLTNKKSEQSYPRNTQIQVDKGRTQLEYNVLCRQARDNPKKYETSGRMRLPVPSRVTDGLRCIVDEDRQEHYVTQANQLASQFSRRQPGLTPTLNRLRASARIFIAPKFFTELEFCAIAGKVNPALKGMSAYYTHSACDIASKFISAVESAAEDYRLPPCETLKIKTSKRKDVLFCNPAASINAVIDLMQSLAGAYADEQARLASLGPMIDANDLLPALNIHETACYTVQQLVVGLRPIGKVGNYTAVPEVLGAMTRDKASITNAERSFSPICPAHLQLLHCSERNRGGFAQLLRFEGKRLHLDEPHSSLACEFVAEKTTVVAKRLSNHYFRHESHIAAQMFNIASKPNWLRHVAAQYVGGKVPQWMADELFGHMRVGRQPMGQWSTAGASHFHVLRDVIQTLVEWLVDDRLLMPVLAITEFQVARS